MERKEFSRYSREDLEKKEIFWEEVLDVFFIGAIVGGTILGITDCALRKSNHSEIYRNNQTYCSRDYK